MHPHNLRVLQAHVHRLRRPRRGGAGARHSVGAKEGWARCALYHAPLVQGAGRAMGHPLRAGQPVQPAPAVLDRVLLDDHVGAERRPDAFQDDPPQ